MASTTPIFFNFHRAPTLLILLLLLLMAKPTFSGFTPKQVFGLRTAKSQPIRIKFCTHLLYGIHLWADLDHDRCMGSSRLNQND